MFKPAILSLLSLVVLSAAYSQDTVSIPLPIYNTADGSSPGTPIYKVGISLNLGASGTSSGYYLYEFDTGGYGFYAGSGGSDVWGSTPTGPNGVQMTYPSGNVYTADVVSTQVTFAQGTTNTGTTVTLTTSPVSVGSITSATNTKNTSDPVNNFNGNIASGTAPLDSYFYGDFGMRLGAYNGLSAIIPQLTGTNLSTGYIINLGGYPGTGTSKGLVGTGTLQIGLTAAQRNPSAWAQVIYLSPPSGTDPTTYPNSNQNNYLGWISGGTLTISGTTSIRSEILFDTGNPNTSITTTSTDAALELQPYLESGTSLLAGEALTLTGSAGESATALSIASTGTDGGSNYVVFISESGTTNATLTNTGIDAFWGNQVMFDLADGWIGINPVPEPQAGLLLPLGLSAILIPMFKKHAKRSGPAP